MAVDAVFDTSANTGFYCRMFLIVMQVVRLEKAIRRSLFPLKLYG